MSQLLAIIFWLIVWLLIELRKKCLREGRPFFSWGKRQSTRFKVSPPQQSQQKYRQRSDNTPGVKKYKNRPSIDAARQKLNNASSKPSFNKTRGNQRPAHKPSINAARQRFNQSSSHRTTQISPRLWNQLNSLTHDPRTTNRLINNAQASNPDKTIDWCAERAIWEIERDRK